MSYESFKSVNWLSFGEDPLKTQFFISYLTSYFLFFSGSMSFCHSSFIKSNFLFISLSRSSVFFVIGLFRVRLIGVKTGRMKNRERKIGWKMTFVTVWLRGGGGEKSGGAHKFSLLPLQNTISPNWSEKWEKYLDKTAPTSFNVSRSFFFWIKVTLAFCFCFFFLSFFGFVRWWVLLLFLLFFFLILILLFF